MIPRILTASICPDKFYQYWPLPSIMATTYSSDHLHLFLLLHFCPRFHILCSSISICRDYSGLFNVTACSHCNILHKLNCYLYGFSLFLTWSVLIPNYFLLQNFSPMSPKTVRIYWSRTDCYLYEIGLAAGCIHTVLRYPSLAWILVILLPSRVDSSETKGLKKNSYNGRNAMLSTVARICSNNNFVLQTITISCQSTVRMSH